MQTVLLRTMSVCRLMNEKLTTLSAKKLKLRTKGKNEQAARAPTCLCQVLAFSVLCLERKRIGENVIKAIGR